MLNFCTFTQIMKKKYVKPKEISTEHRELMCKIGARLKYLREEKGQDIKTFADEVKLSRNAYSAMERGLIYFNFANLMLVLDHHNITAIDFFRDL